MNTTTFANLDFKHAHEDGGPEHRAGTVKVSVVAVEAKRRREPTAPSGRDVAEPGPEQDRNLYLTGGKLAYRYAGKLEGRDVWSSPDAPGLFVMDDACMVPSPRATEIAARGESSKPWF